MVDHSQLSPPPDCLLVFLDETGHERMPNTHTYYGVGGCACLMRDYERLLIRPWRYLREFVTGDAITPLHAANFGRTATKKQLEACAAVFRNNAFMRVGSIGAVTTEMPTVPEFRNALVAIHNEEHLAWVVLRGLANRIIDVAKWTPFRSIAVVFEDNPRSRRLIQSAFAGLNVEENGHVISVEYYFMPKSVHEPGLEAADFIANTLAGHARRSLVEGKTGFGKDFKVVFQSVGPKIASSMTITSVGYTPPSDGTASA